MAKKEVASPMKLTVPAIRAAEPNARRQEVSEQTGVLLDAIDTLLAELAGSGAYGATRGSRTALRSTGERTNCVLVGASTGGPTLHGARPVPPAAA
jgi:chemotaxis response regulator CheB